MDWCMGQGGAERVHVYLLVVSYMQLCCFQVEVVVGGWCIGSLDGKIQGLRDALNVS